MFQRLNWRYNETRRLHRYFNPAIHDEFSRLHGGDICAEGATGDVDTPMAPTVVPTLARRPVWPLRIAWQVPSRRLLIRVVLLSRGRFSGVQRFRCSRHVSPTGTHADSPRYR